MNWFPHFLNPLSALAAAGAAVPLLLLLYFLKLRRKEMPVASTLLWRKAIQDLQVNSPFQKLRRNLLFVLQLLLLLLLCLALSRPITFYHPGAGKISVILIDRSASMNATDSAYQKRSWGRTRLDEAKRQAKDLVDSMERGATAMVIAFDDKAETVQPFTTDAVALKAAIDSITPTDRKTRLKLAYQLAEAQMNVDPLRIQTGVQQEEPDVYVFSDGRVLDAGDLAIRGNVQFKPIGTDEAGNIAIVAMSAKRNYERPTEVQVFARLADFGPDPVKADVELRVSPIDPSDPGHDNFQLRGAASVDLLPDRWNEVQRQKAEQDQDLHERDSVEFTLDLTTAAVIRVEQKQKDGDCLAADDQAAVAVPPPKPLSVLLVTDGDYFLERLIDSLNLKNPAVITPQQYEATVPSNYDVIIFDRGYAPPKLPVAGNFIYFGSVAPGLKIKRVTQDGKTVMLDPTGVLDWKRDHPMLKNLSLNRLRVQEAEKLDVPPDAEVLVEGVKGPLIVLDHEGKSTNLVIAFDLLQSDWPTQPSFPLFMYNALQYLAVGTDLQLNQSYDPGATPRIPRANLAQAADAAGVAELKSLRLIGPDGTRQISIPSTGDFALPALDKVGVYTTSPVIPQFERLVVNLLDPNESNLLPISDKAPGGVGTAIASTGSRSRLDLWWWIVACAALPLLLIEWYVYTRRVHL